MPLLCRWLQRSLHMWLNFSLSYIYIFINFLDVLFSSLEKKYVFGHLGFFINCLYMCFALFTDQLTQLLRFCDRYHHLSPFLQLRALFANINHLAINFLESWYFFTGFEYLPIDNYYLQLSNKIIIFTKVLRELSSTVQRFYAITNILHCYRYFHQSTSGFSS